MRKGTWGGGGREGKKMERESNQEGGRERESREQRDSNKTTAKFISLHIQQCTVPMD